MGAVKRLIDAAGIEAWNCALALRRVATEKGVGRFGAVAVGGTVLYTSPA